MYLVCLVKQETDTTADTWHFDSCLSMQIILNTVNILCDHILNDIHLPISQFLTLLKIKRWHWLP